VSWPDSQRTGRGRQHPRGGFDLAFAVASVFCLIGAVVALTTLRASEASVVTMAEVDEPEANRALAA
jgi:hypothetical protein